MIIYMDKWYINRANHCDNFHHNHEILIHGYDDSKEVIYCIDFEENGSYTELKMRYSDICDGYNALYSDLDSRDVDFFTYLKYIYIIKPLDMLCNFDIDMFKRDIKNYLCGKIELSDQYNLDLSNWETEKEQWEYYFGVNIYDKFIDILKNNRQRYGFEHLDFREFHIIYEHKNLIKRRLEYVAESYNPHMLPLVNEYDSVVSEAEQLRYFVLKYNQLYQSSMMDNEKAEKYINKINKALMSVKKKEYDILSEIMMLLQ